MLLQTEEIYLLSKGSLLDEINMMGGLFQYCFWKHQVHILSVFLFWRKVNGLLILAQDYLDCSSSYFGGNADGNRKPGGNPGGGNKPAKKNEKNIENPSNSCDL